MLFLNWFVEITALEGSAQWISATPTHPGPTPASPSMAKKYRDVKRLLSKAGWTLTRTAGSHEVWMHPDGRRVVVPAGGKDNREVPVGTLASIRRDTGLKELR